MHEFLGIDLLSARSTSTGAGRAPIEVLLKLQKDVFDGCFLVDQLSEMRGGTARLHLPQLVTFRVSCAAMEGPIVQSVMHFEWCGWKIIHKERAHVYLYDPV